MNFKKMLVSALTGASLFAALVGPAAAARVDINVYGASAQYLYWNAAAPAMLTSMGCTVVGQADTSDKKNGITQGTCNSGADTVYIRVASKASYEGLYTLLGNASYADVATEKCNDGDLAIGGGTVPAGLSGFYRKMIDEASCTISGTPATHGLCSAKKCARITLGVSDVAGKSFTQNSHGALLGPLGGVQTDRTFSSIAVPPTFNAYNPIVVPFAFFANTTVTKCADGVMATSPTTCASGSMSTITNMSRSMAVQIFSGQAYNWSDFGGEFTTIPVVACHRHAGSGTAAAFAYAVMNSKWGAPASSVQSTVAPITYFNDGSGDEVNCVQGSGAWTGAGAVGYSDADQATSGTMVRLNYNGEAPTRINIRNGRYDFWTNEWAYEDTTAPVYSTTHPYITAMIAFAADGNNIPNVPFWGANKTAYWASGAEMNFDKVSDQTYPGYVGCTAGSCMTP